MQGADVLYILQNTSSRHVKDSIHEVSEAGDSLIIKHLEEIPLEHRNTWGHLNTILNLECILLVIYWVNPTDNWRYTYTGGTTVTST